MVALILSSWVWASEPEDGPGVASVPDTDVGSTLSIEEAPGDRACRRLVGMAGGVTPRARSWLFIGDGPLAGSASPVFAMTCGLNRGSVSWEVGFSTAPLYRTRRMGSGDAGLAWAMVSVGPLIGNGRFRGGPWGTVAWGRVGGGARLVHLPWRGANGVSRGMEYRLETLYNGNIEVMATVMFAFSTRAY